MKLESVRQKVFLDLYALRGSKGELQEQTPEDMWKRVANSIAGNEKKADRKKWEEEFYRVLEDFKFVPAGRILSGAGTGFQVTYFNCFVIPSPKDSRHGILESLGQLIEIQARAGGVGLNLSSLRPRGSRVKKVNGMSSGPINWATLFSVATHDIVQQGGSRRGATMLMLWDWHPDIEEFITVKQDLTKISGANLSVCLSDAFMEAVKTDKDWDLIYPDTTDPEYDEKWNGQINEWRAMGKKIITHKTIRAKELWNLICTAAWQSAEPGLHFLERSNKRSNTWYFENLISTNPCGEQPLGAWAVCNLGAMNLSAYVTGDDLSADKPGKFDFDALGRDVRVSMRLLDNVIDQTYYFYKENEKCAMDIRRTGLGIMGLADALIKMRLRYGSEEAMPIIKKIFETLRDNAYDASSDIALEKGVFPMFDKEKYLKGYHIQRLPKKLRDKISKQGIRNAVLLTIAPTGTTSTVAGVSSGVEPVYEFSYKMRWRNEGNSGWREDNVYHPLYEEWVKSHPNQEKAEFFVSANDLTPEDHVKVQAIAQEYIDSSISKTVNAPKTHTVDDVKRLYMMAYDQGLKGVTYMRDGSRQGVLERIEEKKDEKNLEKPAKPTGFELPITPRPLMVEGVTYKLITPIGHAFITINHNEKKEPFEVFITIGKSGSDVSAMAEALGRVISLNLRLSSGLAPRERVRQVVAQLSGIGGASSVGFGENRVRSLPDAVAKVLSRHYAFKVNGQVEDKAVIQAVMNAPSAAAETNVVRAAQTDDVPAAAPVQQLALDGKAEPIQSVSSDTVLHDICPECGAASLAYEEGCQKCYGCGFSRC